MSEIVTICSRRAFRTHKLFVCVPDLDLIETLIYEVLEPRNNKGEEKTK